MKQAHCQTHRPKNVFLRILWLVAIAGLFLSYKTVSAAPSDELSLPLLNEQHVPQDFDEHYTIDRATALVVERGWDAIVELGEGLLLPKPARSIALLSWKRVPEAPPAPREPYRRDKHFGNWRRIGDTCVNVRAHVLMRDSSKQVEMRESGCSVKAGEWHDPYTNETFTRAEDLDIDHFVPLNNAYVSGGSRWARKKFCRYGNFLKNDFHLIPAYKDENRKKSDRTPADYLPPNRSFHCEYAIRWLKVKAIWGLVMMPPEVDALQKIIVQNRCDVNTFKMDLREFDANRAATETDTICDRSGSGSLN